MPAQPVKFLTPRRSPTHRRQRRQTARNTSEGIILFASARVPLLETSPAVSLLGVLLRGDEVASLVTVAAAKPLK